MAAKQGIIKKAIHKNKKSKYKITYTYANQLSTSKGIIKNSYSYKKSISKKSNKSY